MLATILICPVSLIKAGNAAQKAINRDAGKPVVVTVSLATVITYAQWFVQHRRRRLLFQFIHNPIH